MSSANCSINTIGIHSLFVGGGRASGHALVGGDCAGDVMIRGRGAHLNSNHIK